jgi:hypothetical protein
MANGENNSNGNGNRAGNFQLNTNSAVSLGLVVVVLGGTISLAYKASEVVTGHEYLKRDIGVLTLSNSEFRAEIADIKRALYRIENQKNGSVAK